MPEVLNTTEVQAEAQTMFSHSGLQGLIRLVCHELDETRTELKQLRHDYAILHTDAVVNAKSVGELEEQLAAAYREREQLIGAANFHAIEQQAAEAATARDRLAAFAHAERCERSVGAARARVAELETELAAERHYVKQLRGEVT